MLHHVAANTAREPALSHRPCRFLEATTEHFPHSLFCLALRASTVLRFSKNAAQLLASLLHYLEVDMPSQ